uniref:Uncharacterized protein n=1 Tax=Oryza meridionalis TaxID=40149 RepID=A0A0E0DSJ4_9ORYZ
MWLKPAEAARRRCGAREHTRTDTDGAGACGWAKIASSPRGPAAVRLGSGQGRRAADRWGRRETGDGRRGGAGAARPPAPALPRRRHRGRSLARPSGAERGSAGGAELGAGSSCCISAAAAGRCIATAAHHSCCRRPPFRHRHSTPRHPFGRVSPPPSRATIAIQSVLGIVPLGVGVMCSLLFVVFPTTRHGIGYPEGASRRRENAGTSNSDHPLRHRIADRIVCAASINKPATHWTHADVFVFLLLPLVAAPRH